MARGCPPALAAAEVATPVRRRVVGRGGGGLRGGRPAAERVPAWSRRPPHGHLAGSARRSGGAAARRGPGQPSRIAATTPTLPVWDACYAGPPRATSRWGWPRRTPLRASGWAAPGFRGSLVSVGALFGQVAGETADLARHRAGRPDAAATCGTTVQRHSGARSPRAIAAVLASARAAVDTVQAARCTPCPNNLKLDRQPRRTDPVRALLPALRRRRRATSAPPARALTTPPRPRLATRVTVTADPRAGARWPEHSRPGWWVTPAGAGNRPWTTRAGITTTR